MTRNAGSQSPLKRFSRSRLKEVKQAQEILVVDRTKGPFPAAPVQEMFWFLSQIQQSSGAYIIRAAFRISGSVDTLALAQAFQVIADRHEVLRARFHMEGDKLIVDHAEADGAFPFEQTLHPNGNDLEGILTALVSQPMDMEQGPLAQAHLVTFPENKHTLLILLHHAVGDDASIDILWSELSQIYAALTAGQQLPDPVKTSAFLDFAQHKLSEVNIAKVKSDQEYWQKTLANCPPLSSPASDTRPRLFDHTGASHSFAFSETLVQRIDSFAAEYNVTPFAVGLAAWVLFLQDQIGQSDIVTAVPVSHRDQPTLAHSIGPMLNTLALRFDQMPSSDPATFVSYVQNCFLNAHAHAALPINQVIELVEPERSPAHHPLFQTMFSWTKREAAGRMSLGKLPVQPLGVLSQTTQLDLSLDLVAHENSLSGGFEYSTALFNPQTIASFADTIIRLLEQLVAGSQDVTSLDHQTNAEISVPCRLGSDPVPSVLDRIASQIEAHPKACAIVDGDQTTTYAALDHRANALAHHLIRSGVETGQRVAICLPNSADCFVAALAIWKVGAAYVPIDPANPTDRIETILADSCAQLVIAASKIALHSSYDVIVIDDLPQGSDTAAISIAYSPDATAYVIYTSGSSGTPKGVEVSHSALATMTAAWEETLTLDDETVFLQMANFAFDVAIADLCRALCFGGHLVLCSKDTLLDVERLAELIREQRVNAGDFTPVILDALVNEHIDHGDVFDRFRLILCGSDIWPRDDAQKLLHVIPDSCRVLHAYGLTETVVDALIVELNKDDSATGPLPIGRPFVPGSVVQITGAEGNAVWGREAGEIWIGGPCLARGYINRADLTAKVFLQSDGLRFFKTGDLGRINARGQIEFLGRADKQIKIRGYRIEPQEIEQSLRLLGAKQAHVMKQQNQLIGYVTGIKDLTTLRVALAQQLPDYMNPAVLIGISALPLTDNNKINEAALPAPSFDQNYRAAHDHTTRVLAEIWQDILGCDLIGLNDHFFERGGHSMLAVRMAMAAGAALDQPVDATLIFTHPTLETFAAAIAKPPQDQPKLQKRARATVLPATAGQQALWYLAQDQNQNLAYNMPFGLTFVEPVAPNALMQALQQLVDRHESLRTGFKTVDGRPQMSILDQVELPFTQITVKRVQLDEIAEKESCASFDLSKAPLVRATLAQVLDGDDVLFVTFHHIIADGWSIDLFAQELHQLYRAFSTNGDTTLPPLALQFGDYAEWQHNRLDAALENSQLAFWDKTLTDAPSLITLPTDFPRPTVQNFAGKRCSVTLNADVSASVRQLAQRCGTSSFVVMLAAWQFLMGRLSGQDDIVTGVPDANRGMADTGVMIGYFVNTLAIRTAPFEARTPHELISNVKSELAQVQANKDVPFSKVVEHLNPQRSPSYNPIFQTMLAWETTPPVTDEHEVALFAEFEMPLNSAKYDLLLEVAESEKHIAGSLQFSAALFTSETACRLVSYLENILRGFVREPDLALADILLIDAETAQTNEMMLQPLPVEIASENRILSRFATIARDIPDAAACTSGDRQLSYRELDVSSAGFAAQLLKLGLVSQQPVAVWADRTPEMIIAVLGIMRAGGCVVPIDPRFPISRINSILQDVEPLGLFVHDPESVKKLGMDRRWLKPIDVQDDAAALPMPDRSAISYILFTSGTSGAPKGVVQTHRMLDNLITWQLNQPGKPKRVLQFASLAFDVAFQEIFSTLCAGATLVLMPMNLHQDVAYLGKFLISQKVERAFLPAAVLHVLRVELDMADKTVACEIITAGESLKLTEALAETLRALGSPRICNQYGPSETHVVSQHVITRKEMEQSNGDAPIGRPIANTRLHVLDAAMKLVPPGIVGELYIGGDGVAGGYLKRAELTAEKFVDDPFIPGSGQKLFKSGDRARRDTDGVLHFLGRLDDQVKIHGNRVEPGEVETLLRRLPDMQDAIVLARETPAGHAALIAYCVYPHPVGTLTQTVAQQLPTYLCPQEYIILDKLPLNTNGKVDRKALPAPKWQRTNQTFTPPVTPTEITLCGIWMEALGADRIGALDDFFALGGHSLLAARILHRINLEFGCELGLSTLLSNSVLRNLADRIDQWSHGNAETRITQEITPDHASRHAPFPLTDIQQAYLVGREKDLSLGGVSAHSYSELRIEQFDVPRFETALNAVIARHDMLRAVFQEDGMQVVLADVPIYRIIVHNVVDPSQEATAQALETQRARLSHQVLDTSQWPLFGFEVTSLADGSCHLHISLDALIVDAASTSLLMGELMAFYRDPDLHLDNLNVTFRDYVIADQEFRAGDAYATALDYWIGRFDELPTGPNLPLLCQPDTIETPSFRRQDHCIEQPLWDEIKHNAGKHQITGSGMLLAAFSMILDRYAENSEFSLSLPLFNRKQLHRDINAVIGDFSSVLLFQTPANPPDSFADYARVVQTALWRDMDNSQVSGIEAMRALGRRFGVQPQGLPVVFNSTLTEMDVAASQRRQDQTLKAQNIHTITQTPQVWLDHTIVEEDGALYFNWDSIIELFPDSTIEAMFDEYCALLHALALPEFWLSAKQSLFENAPATPALSPQRLTLTEMVVHQARLTPDRIAIISSERTLSYDTLLSEAETLAANLQDAGTEPGDCVALLTPVGWEQCVAVLGCLIAGGVYVPIDPEFPNERVNQLLTRTRAKVALTSQSSPWQPVPDLDASVLEILPEPTLRTPLKVSRNEDDLAYVIFTSGSTGEPKGVMIDHGGAVNTVLDINARITLHQDDRILGVSALNFDLSVYDIFGPLSQGAALVLPDQEMRRDPNHWRALINAHSVTIWNAVPALTSLLIEDWESGDKPLPLRCALLSGDWIPLTLPNALSDAAPGINIWSLGGATEASIWSIGYLINEVSPTWTSIPYGRALGGQSIHVLDNHLAPRPALVTGELYIGGRGLALGYWDDPTRTDAAFVIHPITGDRLYRTGDLGRLMPDGNIEFLGRADDQVKVQGYRIELGGVEKALERNPNIQAAAVKIVGDTMGQKRLAAYVVRTDSDVTVDDLRDHLAALLPAYEIPSSFAWLDALPLSANGKVDRKQLPDVPEHDASKGPFILESEAEKGIVEIVCQTLGQDALNPQANLLSLGASSLDIVRISNAVASVYGFRPPLAKFMRAPTVIELISLWRDSDAAKTEKPQVPPTDPALPDFIEDAAARTAFKAAQKGLRQLDGQRSPLSNSERVSALDRYEANRSTRQFVQKPIEMAQFSDLLSCLLQNTAEDRPRFQFASAGGLYPVQTYIYVKHGQINGIAPGGYYLHPKERTLIKVETGIVLDGDCYDYFVNRPTFEAAAFAVFFIADLSAISPIYGDASHNMVLLETGQMAQHLTNRAGEVGLGLCGIGTLEKDILSDLFDLSPAHQLIYSMLGGIPETQSVPHALDDETEEFEI
ncbi:MAG: amino acid adenylation domain-containing protein [Litoreibacter sp.]